MVTIINSLKLLYRIFLERNIPFISSKWRSSGLQTQGKDKQLFVKHMKVPSKEDF